MNIKDNTDIVCFCFGYSKEDIINDLNINGRSLIMERIQLAKREGGCDCTNKHPQGR